MHRDGNALAINKFIIKEITLSKNRIDRKPTAELADAMRNIHEDRNESIRVGVPHILSTHSVVLYRYLKENNLAFSIDKDNRAAVQAMSVAPPKAPAFIKGQSARAIPAAFEQSLPWADVVETEGFGKIAWYSKDVMKWPNGHIECIAIGSDNAINTKYKAMQEVMEYIKIGGEDIEKARNAGGAELDEIVAIVRKYIPTHTSDAINASLDPRLKRWSAKASMSILSCKILPSTA
jgi:NitT/TauT family transport system substrate-binding protein